MSRARNIKPGFFSNEDLAECSFEARLCFAGLWTLADREGRLEDRPKRIKGELFRFDNVDIEPLLDELERRRFILRYEVDGLGIVQVVEFSKHQNPHHREANSELPPPPSPGLDGDCNPSKPKAQPPLDGDKARYEPRKQVPRDDLPRGSSRADSLIPDSLIPDSGFLIPDSRDPLAAQGGAGGSASPPPAAPAPKPDKVAKTPTPKASKRVPADWLVSADLQRWAREKAAGVDIRAETEAFRDCEFTKAHVDWDATWRTWMRKAAKDLARPTGGRGLSIAAPQQSAEERLAETRRLLGIAQPTDQDVIDV